ncbi:hypothetical protein J3E68DRAFT_282191 [Trichoderma sp. SZMC 28012]
MFPWLSPKLRLRQEEACRQRGAALRSHDLELLPAPRPSPLSFYIYIRSAIAISNFVSSLLLFSLHHHTLSLCARTNDSQLLIAAAP